MVEYKNMKELPPKLNFWYGIAMIVGIIIGGGIFRTPALVANHLGNPYVIIGLWVIGGIISLFGAFTFAELSAMFPRSGGIYIFLYEAFGSMVAFTFSWAFLLFMCPLAIATILTIFSEHFIGLTHLPISPVILTCITILLLTQINVFGMKFGASIVVILTVLKVFALIALGSLGFIFVPETNHFVIQSSPTTFFQAIVPVMAGILWTYDGWSIISSISAEVENPQKHLPRIFFAGVFIVILIYVKVNILYLTILSIPEMQKTPNIAPLIMNKIFGNFGAIAITLLVIVSTLSAAQVVMITGSRIIFAQGRYGHNHHSFGNQHKKYETPHLALYFQGIISCLLVLGLKTFSNLMGSFVFSIWIFYGLAAIGLIVLRIRRPKAKRPYKCFGYPFVPFIFIVTTLLMTVVSIFNAPSKTLPWIGVLVLISIIHQWWYRK